MRASRALCLAVAIILFLCHASAIAGSVSQGSREYYGGLSFVRSSYSWEDYDLGSQTVLTVAPGLGYFVSDNVEFRTDLVFTFIGYSNGGSESMHAIGADVLALWHFPSEGNVVPFIGAGAGISVAGDSDGGDYEPLFAVPQVSAGMKVFLTETACLTFEARYRHEINGLYAEDISGSVIGLVAGFSIFP